MKRGIVVKPQELIALSYWKADWQEGWNVITQEDIGWARTQLPNMEHTMTPGSRNPNPVRVIQKTC